MGFGVSLPHGPSLNLIEIDNLLCCDQDRLIESLPVAPMVERRKPVQHVLEFPLTRGRNEVEITRLVESASVNLHCSPTGQHRGDSR